jgi:hypothetical protein
MNINLRELGIKVLGIRVNVEEVGGVVIMIKIEIGLTGIYQKLFNYFKKCYLLLYHVMTLKIKHNICRI